jgi:hypothetical protein
MLARIGHVLARWIIVAATVVCLSLVIYVVAQQALRQGANDPQIGMAEDAAAALAEGQTYDGVLPAQIVAFDRSLKPFLIVFDPNGKPVASSAYLEGGVPAPPRGVFDHARTHGQDRVTWQPQPGMRLAAVVQYFAGEKTGFVLAARSLREVERRANQLLTLTVLGALATLAVTLVVIVLIEAIAALIHHQR